MKYIFKRDNKAYDKFRAGLVEINAPPHVIQMLPNFADLSQQISFGNSSNLAPVSSVKLEVISYFSAIQTTES